MPRRPCCRRPGRPRPTALPGVGCGAAPGLGGQPLGGRLKCGEAGAGRAAHGSYDSAGQLGEVLLQYVQTADALPVAARDGHQLAQHPVVGHHALVGLRSPAGAVSPRLPPAVEQGLVADADRVQANVRARVQVLHERHRVLGAGDGLAAAFVGDRRVVRAVADQDDEALVTGGRRSGGGVHRPCAAPCRCPCPTGGG